MKMTMLSGAKLVPFNSGCVSQNCPTKTDDALQHIFISGHYFPQKCWRGGGGDFFRTLKKRSKIFYRHKPVILRVKKIFPHKFLLKHG